MSCLLLRRLRIVVPVVLSLWLAQLTSVSGQDAARTWRQTSELQPAVERGAVPPAAAPQTPLISDAAFHGGPVPQWIWGADNNRSYVLRTTFTARNIRAARLKAACDNIGAVLLNGQKVAKSSEWQEPMSADVTKWLMDGTNTLEAEVSNAGGIAAFILKLAWLDADGKVQHVVSDTTWQVLTSRDAASSVPPELRGKLGDSPWGNVLATDAPAGRVPAGTFEVLPGFQVEKLFTVPKDELGSWVCITFDNKGRLLASDQGDLGICRVTVPPLTAGGTTASETRVERLDFSRCSIQPTSAQGMLWAFDSLYLCLNGGPGSGLYRARDLNGDDQFDEVTKLREFRGGGEHGPHALRLSPDGQRIFVICGNHTQPPFQPQEQPQHPEYTSRIRTNWSEDLLLPRMWDANGHARGVLAPGGWIASTDPDGRTWDVFSIGYRNPYDMAFNGDGELFAYDADMEWDMGMPWYRPTRVVHATSGSEFGWRSGSGKWPGHYPDSLPTLVDIGPGSPVGVEFGYGCLFPAKYQTALYICDWTFGTMYAIHITPHGSSYTATREEFVSRTPLPLTDVAAGPDGALYFSVGGRGTQSELFRVTYAGSEATAPVATASQEFADARQQRRAVEQLHGPHTSAQAALESIGPSATDAQLQADRYLRYARLVALSRAPVAELRQQLQAAAARQPVNPVDIIDLTISVSRASEATRGLNGVGADGTNDPESLAAALSALRHLRPGQLPEAQQLDYLRALSLVLLRLGNPDDAERAALLQELDPLFPARSDVLNRELVQMLVYLQSPEVVQETIQLLQQPPRPTPTENLQDLIARNRGYGSSIAGMLANQPDQQQIWYAFVLRNVRTGWTIDQRKAYFGWFERAQQWAGGASFKGFLRNIEREAFENATENERVLIEASGARKPFLVPELPKPTGPGRDWTLEEVRALAESQLQNRDFENGQKMFAATRCILCHRFAGDGGATGPDLTQLAGRFNLKDLTEAIMEPSKVVSDQYRGSSVVTRDGKVINGRIVSETAAHVTVLTDPEDSTKIVEVATGNIEEILPAQVSLMPRDLLKPLNQEEILDLLAYLLSRGDKGNGMFKR